MLFKYFAGPEHDMADYEGIQRCNLCGSQAPCFDLASAFIPELDGGKRDGKFGCIHCLAKGRFEFWHDTEIGLLEEEGLRHYYSNHKPVPSGFSSDSLTMLRRTPQIITWQQERWLTHCNDFMVYLGTWQPADFQANAPDGDGRKLFLEMTDPEHADVLEGFEGLFRTGEPWGISYYTFRCLKCGKLRGYWDCD